MVGQKGAGDPSASISQELSQGVGFETDPLQAHGVDAGRIPTGRLGDFPTYEVFPEWWTDPAHIQFVNHEVQYSVEITDDALGNGVPAGEPIVFALDESGAVEAQLVTSEAAVVRRATVHDNVLRIDTAGLEPGSFTLRLTTPDTAEVTTLRVAPPYSSGFG